MLRANVDKTNAELEVQAQEHNQTTVSEECEMSVRAWGIWLVNSECSQCSEIARGRDTPARFVVLGGTAAAF